MYCLPRKFIITTKRSSQAVAASVASDAPKSPSTKTNIPEKPREVKGRQEEVEEEESEEEKKEAEKLISITTGLTVVSVRGSTPNHKFTVTDRAMIARSIPEAVLINTCGHNDCLEFAVGAAVCQVMQQMVCVTAGTDRLHVFCATSYCT